MTNHNEKQPRLPSRDIAYAFTVAMHFAQRFELDLRAILYTADYHGWGKSIELDERQLDRFTDTHGFIDEATCGAVRDKVIKSDLIKGETKGAAIKAFEEACKHRNKLAHGFLAEQDFDGMTAQAEREVLDRLNAMSRDLYQALRISRAVRENVEIAADEMDKKMQEYFGEFMVGTSDPNRHYATRMRKKRHG